MRPIAEALWGACMRGSSGRTIAWSSADETSSKSLQDLVWHLGRKVCRQDPGNDSLERDDELLQTFSHSFEILGDRRGLSDCRYHLGNIAYIRGDYPTAAERYRDCLGLLEGTGDAPAVARACHQLGMVAQKTGDYAGA